MTVAEMIIEFFKSWLGGGTIVGLFSAILIWKSNKKGRDIDWYDRAIVQVKELDAKIIELEKIITKLEDIISKLNDKVLSEKHEKERLQEVVKQMQDVIISLKQQLEENKEVTKKGSGENEQV